MVPTGMALVVLTREPEDNAPLSRRLSEVGLTVVEYPCLTTKTLPWEPSMLPVGVMIQDVQLVAFTSRRSVRSLTPEVVASLSKCRLAAVGAATARAVLERFGRGPDVVSESRSADGLADELIPTLHPQDRVLLFRGDLSVGVLQDRLRATGMEVIEAVVYRNEEPKLEPLALPPVPEGFPSRTLLVVLASPSIADRFFGLNPSFLDCAWAVAFGKTTAARLREIGCRLVRVTVNQEPESVAQCVFSILTEVGA